MALKDTIKQMRTILHNITQDLEKADRGNKAASQRVRTGTVRLEKIAKGYRKESVKTEKTTKGRAKPKQFQIKTGKAAAKKAPAKSTTKSKPKTKKTHAKSRAFSFQRRATAKLPSRAGR